MDVDRVDGRVTVFRFNKENIFPEDSLDMGYIVREPIINETFGDIRFRRWVVFCPHHMWICGHTK